MRTHLTYTTIINSPHTTRIEILRSHAVLIVDMLSGTYVQYYVGIQINTYVVLIARQIVPNSLINLFDRRSAVVIPSGLLFLVQF